MVLQVLARVPGQSRVPDPTNVLREVSCRMWVPRHRRIRSEGLGLSQVSSDTIIGTQWLCDPGWFIHFLRSSELPQPQRTSCVVGLCQASPCPPPTPVDSHTSLCCYPADTCALRGQDLTVGKHSLSLGSIRPFLALSSYQGFPSKNTGNSDSMLFI